MKKALVHDWYYTNGGAEKVIQSINSIWSDFENYALIDFLNDENRQSILNGKEVHTSFIQNLPTARNNHRKFLQLFPYAIEQFDLSDYEVVISSSASVAKGALTNQDQLHICYCHSPMRYAWDLYFDYLKDKGLSLVLRDSTREGYCIKSELGMLSQAIELIILLRTLNSLQIELRKSTTEKQLLFIHL